MAITGSRKTGPAKDTVKRLNQLLASAGYGSRRACEELITEGRVRVDGQVIEKQGVSVDTQTQTVHVDGVLLRQQKLVYYAVNKPKGVVTTNSDPQGRTRVIDLVPPSERVFPVGRLDRSSEGLILLTNDGDLAQQLAHPKFGVQKIYRVTVAGRVDAEAMKKMRQGIYIAEGHVRVDGARVLKTRPKATDLEIRLREGKNREIRRILARLGHKVQELRRIAIGPLRLGEVPPGAYRPLSREEIVKLKAAAEQVVIHGRGDDATPHEAPRGNRKTASRSGTRSAPGSLKKRTKTSNSPTSRPGGKKVGTLGSGPLSRGQRSASAAAKKAVKTATPRTGAVIGADASERRDETPLRKRVKRVMKRSEKRPSKRSGPPRGK